MCAQMYASTHIPSLLSFNYFTVSVPPNKVTHLYYFPIR